MTNGATLIGFTLTNGATQTSGDIEGGGLWAQSVAVTVSNCVLTANAAVYGGGAFRGTLNTCTLTGNLAAGGAGGGAYGGTLNNCKLTGNVSTDNGGGAYNATLNNSTLTSNSAVFGGGALLATLNNCTLSGNSANTHGGGVYLGTLNNCIVYFNTAPTSNNYYSSTFSNSCTTPLPAGTGNITNVPMFVVQPEKTGTAVAITLTITNIWPGANYRTGVRLP